MDFTKSSTFNLARYLRRVISPVMGKTAHYTKSSADFCQIYRNNGQLWRLITIHPCANHKNNRHPHEPPHPWSLSAQSNHTWCSRSSPLGWRICESNLTFPDRLYQQTAGLPVGSLISPVSANIFMEWFKDTMLKSAPVVPTVWWIHFFSSIKRLYHNFMPTSLSKKRASS